ncbi:hypothetical protein V8B97DRAFT_1646040 [Scleroderma yunnanense]
MMGAVAAIKMFLTLAPQHPSAPSPPPPSAYLDLAQLSDDDLHVAISYYQAAIDALQNNQFQDISLNNLPCMLSVSYEISSEDQKSCVTANT